MLVITFIVLVNYSVKEKKYKHIVYNLYIKKVAVIIVTIGIPVTVQ
jgi:hypothetical protein